MNRVQRNSVCYYIHRAGISKEAWGIAGFTRIFHTAGSRFGIGSKNICRVCRVWEISKSQLCSKEPANELEWLELRLWTPPRKVNHINNKEVDFLTAAEKILGGIGYIQMEDAVKPDGSFR